MTDVEITPMSVTEFLGKKVNTPQMVQRIESFNKKLQDALVSGPFSNDALIILSFDEFGYDWDDVSFVRDAGFNLCRDSACLWWEVSLPKKCSN